jgi:type VI secretion system protein ImpM
LSAVPLGDGGKGTALGFYGKLPARADFVGRRLPRAFVDPWDAWLQAAMSASRDGMGEAWLPAYLNGPIWCFVLSPGLCGPDAAAGVLIPSVDRVGRYFPLTLAVTLPDCRGIAGIPDAAADWFPQLEELAVSALDDGFDFDTFDRQLEALGAPPDARADGASIAEAGWRAPLDRSAGLSPIYAALLEGAAGAAFIRYSLWWTTGSDRVAASFLVARGLPRPEAFAALLDGDWARWGGEGEPMADERGYTDAG